MKNIIQQGASFIGFLLLNSMLNPFVFAETWNMATPYGDKYFHTKNIRQFVKQIEEATGGELKIKVHSGASLYKSTEIFNAVRSRQVQMGELLMANEIKTFKKSRKKRLSKKDMISIGVFPAFKSV